MSGRQPCKHAWLVVRELVSASVSKSVHYNQTTSLSHSFQMNMKETTRSRTEGRVSGGQCWCPFPGSADIGEVPMADAVKSCARRCR